MLLNGDGYKEDGCDGGGPACVDCWGWARRRGNPHEGQENLYLLQTVGKSVATLSGGNIFRKLVGNGRPGERTFRNNIQKTIDEFLLLLMMMTIIY